MAMEAVVVVAVVAVVVMVFVEEEVGRVVGFFELKDVCDRCVGCCCLCCCFPVFFSPKAVNESRYGRSFYDYPVYGQVQLMMADYN